MVLALTCAIVLNITVVQLLAQSEVVANSTADKLARLKGNEYEETDEELQQFYDLTRAVSELPTGDAGVFAGMAVGVRDQQNLLMMKVPC
jgi:hypothetical protein